MGFTGNLMGFTGNLMGFTGNLMGFTRPGYVENGHRNSGFSHETW